MGVRISEAPEPLKILLIDTTHVEIYWNQELALNGGMTSAYHILYKGQELPLHERTDSEEWHVGTVYEPKKKRTTVSLEQPGRFRGCREYGNLDREGGKCQRHDCKQR